MCCSRSCRFFTRQGWKPQAAERDLAQLELDYTKKLAEKQGVSQKEVKLYEAKLAKAQAKVDLAEAELNFTKVKAPFDGIVDLLKRAGQPGQGGGDSRDLVR